jgi:chemotaxis protein methyltransferase CheR
VLATARQGEYGPSSLRATSSEKLGRYFTQISPNRVRVRDDVRAWVSFGHHNLQDPETGPLISRMDAVFCRNVLIYFDTPARQRVLRLIYDKLVPGGYLMLGHSENLINLSADFELVHLRGDLVYRKPDPTGGSGS